MWPAACGALLHCKEKLKNDQCHFKTTITVNKNNRDYCATKIKIAYKMIIGLHGQGPRKLLPPL